MADTAETEMENGLLTIEEREKDDLVYKNSK